MSIILHVVGSMCKKRLIFKLLRYNIVLLWGVSSAGLERLPVTQKVEGSSPLHPATNF